MIVEHAYPKSRLEEIAFDVVAILRIPLNESSNVPKHSM